MGIQIRAAFSFLALILSPSHSWAGGSGDVEVISASSIVVAGERLRVQGVVAPGLGQTCTALGVPWRCGIVARLWLEQRLSDGVLVCTGSQRDQHGQRFVSCVIENDNSFELGRWLVRSGWALADADTMPDYVPMEHQAKAQNLGIWKGGFTPSDEWTWFARNVLDDQANANLGCDSCALRHKALARRKKLSTAD